MFTSKNILKMLLRPIRSYSDRGRARCRGRIGPDWGIAETDELKTAERKLSNASPSIMMIVEICRCGDRYSSATSSKAIIVKQLCL
jgi:hypothetical protein